MKWIFHVTQRKKKAITTQREMETKSLKNERRKHRNENVIKNVNAVSVAIINLVFWHFQRGCENDGLLISVLFIAGICCLSTHNSSSNAVRLQIFHANDDVILFKNIIINFL